MEDTGAARLHPDLVELLRAQNVIRTAPVDAAMTAVPRHLFLPGVPHETAYAPDDAVVTTWNADGTALSSASAPRVVAAMLEQLDVHPGHRILEIGAGTGYNAALLSRLTGPTGTVTTIDLDQDIVDDARQALTASGHGNVRVICGDGELGEPDHALYDRIIVTVGAWDLPPPGWTNSPRTADSSCRCASTTARPAPSPSTARTPTWSAGPCICADSSP